MQRIYYAGDRFLTGTDLARALVEYAAALGRRGSTAVVEVPVINEDQGSRGMASILIGPASQLIAEDIDSEVHEEIRDEELVERLRQLTAELSPMHPIAGPSAADQDANPTFYDWTDEV